eukprot:1464290-Ditylum_brightwellii.AAC.1
MKRHHNHCDWSSRRKKARKNFLFLFCCKMHHRSAKVEWVGCEVVMCRECMEDCLHCEALCCKDCFIDSLCFWCLRAHIPAGDDGFTININYDSA